MNYFVKMAKFCLYFLFPLVCVVVLSFSCVQSPKNSRVIAQSLNADSSASGDGIGHASTNPDDTGDIAQDGDEVTPSQVEIRWFVDPFDSSYKSKLTLPKNFSGILYMSVLNAPNLSDAFVNVRFNFGINSTPIIIPATDAKSINGGIIPQTDVKLLVLNFKEAYFEFLNLPYDLFDYNSYESGDVPTVNNRDDGLYCRGLRLEHDPTFAKGTASTCSSATDECLYAYAKINDSTMYQSGMDLNPTSAQIDSSGDGYFQQSGDVLAKKCLANSGTTTDLRNLFNFVNTYNFTYGETISLDGENYVYYGPYYPSAASLWQITDNAVVGSKGIFEARISNAPNDTNAYWWSKAGAQSKMFPLAGTTELKKGLDYFGSSDPFGARALTQLSSDGETLYMDGCNIRTLYRDPDSIEQIQSCNVVATIDIIAKRKGSDGVITEEVVTTSKDVKLQIVRASRENSEGLEDIITSYKACTSSNECGKDECCFNKRCWSKAIVSQCPEDTDQFMTGENGEHCSSDFQCQSLCCNESTSTCQIHQNNASGTKLCAKPAGQSCVAKGWCMPEVVEVCKVYKINPTSSSGAPQCAVHCFPESRFGSCVNGTCRAPETPTPEVLDDDFDCSSAPSLPQS